METKKKRERHSAAFKAKVAIDAIKEKETLQELASKYKVSAVTISKWKAEFLSNSALSNTLEARVCTEVLDEAIAKYGKPEIQNSDQGSQFTCPRWVNKLKAEGIQIRMDGKGRAKDRSASRRVTLGLSKNYGLNVSGTPSSVNTSI